MTDTNAVNSNKDQLHLHRFVRFSASRETWDLVMYAFLGVFKVFVLIFNVVPYLALLIIG